jgi:hypothetical protein
MKPTNSSRDIGEIVMARFVEILTTTPEERAEQHRQDVAHKARVRADALAQFAEEDRW